MAHFIRCPSCGCLLGAYSDFVEWARNAQNEEILFQKSQSKKPEETSENPPGTQPEKMSINGRDVPSIGHILDAAGINNMCCRMRVMSCMGSDRVFDR